MTVYRTLDDVTVGAICKTSVYGWIVLVEEIGEEGCVLCRILDDQTGRTYDNQVGASAYWHISDLAVVEAEDVLSPATMAHLGLGEPAGDPINRLDSLTGLWEVVAVGNVTGAVTVLWNSGINDALDFLHYRLESGLPYFLRMVAVCKHNNIDEYQGKCDDCGKEVVCQWCGEDGCTCAERQS